MSSATICVEETATVAEAAGFMVKIDKSPGPKIVGAHLENSFGNLLSVGSDVLHGSATHVAGNACETLDTSVSMVHGVANKLVPVSARSRLEQHPLPFPALTLRTNHADAHHQSIKTRVAHKQIAPASEDKERDAALTRELRRLAYLTLGLGFTKEPGRAANVESRIGSERNVFLKLD